MAVVRSKQQKHQSCLCPPTKKFRNVLIFVGAIGALANLSLMLRFLFGEQEENTTQAVPYHSASHYNKMSPVEENQKLRLVSETVSLNNSSSVIKIGHVVSLIKCGKVASTTGFLDAAAVLRHSIHQQSVHNNNNNKISKYSYQMHAIIHENCASHSSVLERLGYKTWIVQPPVAVDEIKGEWYRNHVEGENCCGSAEFIKLYAYNITQHPIVVHWDMDVAILQPMDDLYDAMLYASTSPEGVAARQRLELQHPTLALPEHIDAFFTRDVTSSQPWEPVQGVQGGFLVARPNPTYLEEYLEFIREGNYVRGRGAGSGWGGGMGYGGFQGAMAYQGAVAYFYDVVHPNTAVELNACRWNQVVADVLWRGPANMDTMHLHCRQRDLNGAPNKTDCEDCRVTPIEFTRTVHYTACKKPWECQIPHPRQARDKSQQYRLNHLTNITTCMSLFQKWFDLRRDFETKLQHAAGVIPSDALGGFERDSFLGYCHSPGRYIAMQPPPTDYNIEDMYGM